MQASSHTSRNLLIALVAIALVVGAGYMYMSRDRAVDDSLLTSSVPGTGSAVEGDLLSALFQLKKLKLDESIFQSPVWMSLSDFGKILTPETPGRTNPFAPFGVSSTATTAPATFVR